MDAFRGFLGEVCRVPGRYVGSPDFRRVAILLEGYDFALKDLRPDLGDAGLGGFREWLAVRLDSCVRTPWWAIVMNEDVGPDKFAGLVRLYDEFACDRRARGIAAILADFEQLCDAIWVTPRDRRCWCEGPDPGDADVGDEDED